jgi:hypothetical protein
VLQFYFSLLELLLVMPLNGGQLLSQTQNGWDYFKALLKQKLVEGIDQLHACTVDRQFATWMISFNFSLNIFILFA